MITYTLYVYAKMTDERMSMQYAYLMNLLE